MTPEQIEAYKAYAQINRGLSPDMAVEVLAALEEAQRQRDALDREIADGGPKGRNYTNEQYARLLALGNEASRELEYAKQQAIVWNDESVKLRGQLEEAQQQAELAYAAYEGLQGFCVSRGEYDSLLNKHSVLARAHREAQQTIARLTGLFQNIRKLPYIDGPAFSDIRPYVNSALEGETQP